MSTRSIVTSQPDVACDVCERRLLRGEQPDTFLAAGEPRIVCELCAPRAAHQGWKRGSALHEVGQAPLRNGRRRALFGRLRQARRSEEATEGAAGPFGRDGDPYDFLGGGSESGALPEGEHAGAVPAENGGYGGGEVLKQRQSAPVRYDGPLQRAIDVFNAGEYPRRVASLTRSLGAPEVTVREGEAVASSVVIVLAWELCWYTYEVDLDNLQGLQARAIAQGTELTELGAEDRLANALADERGALALI